MGIRGPLTYWDFNASVHGSQAMLGIYKRRPAISPFLPGRRVRLNIAIRLILKCVPRQHTCW